MNKIIHSKVVLSCDIDKAFEMFTRNSQLEMWLAKSAEVEPYVGGKYELFWDLENKEANSTIGCRITALEKSALLCFEWKGPVNFREFMNTADPLTHVAIFFTSQSANTTDVHLVHMGWQTTAEWDEARQWFTAVWNHALNELKRMIEAG